MRRYPKRKHKISIKFISILIGIGLFLILVFSLFFKSGLFQIKKIDISGKDISCVDQNQLKNSSEIIGKNLLLLNPDSLVKKIKGKFICIKDISLSKVLPSKIMLDITGRQPKAILVTLKSNEATVSSDLENIATPSAQQSSVSYLIDDEAVIFSKDSNNLDLPRIFLYDTALSLGNQTGENNTKNALKILNQVNIFGLDVKSSIIQKNLLIIFSTPKIIFKLDNTLDKQIASLQLILKIAKIDSSILEFIDLRFDKPVVRFAPKKN